MELSTLEGTNTGLRAGYECPVRLHAGGDLRSWGEACRRWRCCGNQFAVGPRASASLSASPGWRPEVQTFDAPWGERLEAAWLVAPSAHGRMAHADHDHGTERVADSGTHAVDPVCGMTVDPEAARARGLHTSHEGRDHFFCGKGCKLEFGDDPGRYLDPDYVPSM